MRKSYWQTKTKYVQGRNQLGSMSWFQKSKCFTVTCKSSDVFTEKSLSNVKSWFRYMVQTCIITVLLECVILSVHCWDILYLTNHLRSWNSHSVKDCLNLQPTAFVKNSSAHYWEILSMLLQSPFSHVWLFVSPCLLRLLHCRWIL